MRIDDFSLGFNCPGCPSWGTAIVSQDAQKKHLIKKDVASNIVIGMMHKCVTLNTRDFSLPIGKGSKMFYGNTGFESATSEPMLVSVFDKVFINDKKIPAPFIIAIIRDRAEAHKGRLQIKYTPKLNYGGISNDDFFRAAVTALNITSTTPWVVYDIDIRNQEELIMKALIGDDVNDLENKLRDVHQIEDDDVSYSDDDQFEPIEPEQDEVFLNDEEYSYIAAIKTKPFLILGGFSGTGKSQKVKELAFATCPAPSPLSVSETSPGNYLLVSVKPNWHDATDITGFRSSVNKNYYVTDFMRFLVKAKQYPEVPFFVCLDEMNLAPVEEYFADFLSVIESRKKKSDGSIVTDALVSASVFNDKDYADDFNIFLKLGLKPIKEVKDITEFTAEIKANGNESDFFAESWIVDELKRDGLTIPQNVIIIGTVNMDDTTNSFSRKVIDRAMTFETIVGKFDDDYFNGDALLSYVKEPRKGKLFISDEVRATQMLDNEDGDFTLEDGEKQKILNFINNINEDLEGTPFKISYRILNETILLYRAKQKIAEIMGDDFEEDVTFKTDLNSIFDDILIQKILPRIEGDYEKCNSCLTKLSTRASENDWDKSLEKIEFMIRRFGKDKSGFTSFWN